MHIAFLTPEYPHQKVNHAAGIGTSIKNLALALAKNGVRVSVVVYSQKEFAVFQENGVTIHLIPHKKYRFFTWYFYRKHLQNYLNQLTIQEKVDLIEAPDWTGITAFMKFKVPLVIRFHGSDAYFCHLENRKQKFKNFWFEKLALKSAKAFIAPTKFAGELTQQLFKIKSQQIQIIYNGLQLSHFSNKNPGVFEPGLILYYGTIIRKKGVLELPEIMKNVILQYPDVTLILIGGDSADVKTNSKSTWELLKSNCDTALKNKIKYLGKVPYHEVQEYIKKANVCIFPTYAETLGMVTIESMAMQKAVVNSNIGWANELIIDSESGFLIYPSDHEQYAKAIVKVLQNPELAQEIGKKARERVEAKFDIEKIAEQNIEFYKSQL
ncbi:glycosyltransferase [Flavobacterium sp. NST-5]|uniref:Glycosyltransferase n=1 Tax=Flavobacterium ichthyis TaxID=2698827 RepID=A0ABW9ZDK0_9FLAO|nr:glycosyltransferase family 4 protein [Flavobacterium ichthyis]NBL64843.1 glycosyltransferase [Flavobacterium ichthyis]